MAQVSPKERALLHLFDARSHLKERPSESFTQQGIALALGMNRTHITRVLKPLINDGLVDMEKGRPEGGERRLTYYLLNPNGLLRVKEILNALGEEELEIVEGGKKVRMHVKDVLSAHPYLRTLEVVDSIGGVLRPQAPGKRLIASDQELSIGEFFGREEQLSVATEFLAGKGAILAIYANHGYGSSTFLKKVALELFDGAVMWHDLTRNRKAETLIMELEGFSAALGVEGGIDGLKLEKALICLDNYREPSEELVDLLTDIVPRLRGGKCKLAVAMREETPSYERFYLRPDVLSGDVVEVKMHRFDERTARKLLGEDLDDESFQLIYMLTRGQPLALDMVKRGDAEGLNELRLKEEVRFLMYLRTKKNPSEKSN
jgi:DNA-binding MarR family transcriptional regulator